MYGLWMNWWSVVVVILSVVIVVISFYEKPRSYRIAAACFIAIAVGSAFFYTFPWFFGIRMAQAFVSSSATWGQWIPPVLMAVSYLLPALMLTPIVPVNQAKRWALILVGIQLAYYLLPLVIGMSRGRLGDGILTFGGGITTIYLFLLWLRVHELRVKTAGISVAPGAS